MATPCLLPVREFVFGLTAGANLAGLETEKLCKTGQSFAARFFHTVPQLMATLRQLKDPTCSGPFVQAISDRLGTKLSDADVGYLNKMHLMHSRTKIESRKQTEVSNRQSHQEVMDKFRLDIKNKGDTVVGVVRYADNYGFL